MTVRRMEAQDLPEVERIQREARGEAAQWTPEEYLGYEAWVADEGGKVEGFLVLREVFEGEAEVLNLAVAPAARRRGWAAQMLQMAGQRALFLEVRQSNEGARRFYSAQGFRETGRRKNYYRDPDEDAIVMGRSSVITRECGRDPEAFPGSPQESGPTHRAK